MKIEIKRHLIQEGVIDHLKNNWGKYAAAAAAAGTLHAAGAGYLGIVPQDAVQSFGAKMAGGLENDAVGNNAQGLEDAAYETYSRPDNIFGPGDNDGTFTYQNMMQKEHQLANLQNGAASAIRTATHINGSPDTTNFYIRHPLVSSKLAIDGAAQSMRPIFTMHDSD